MFRISQYMQELVEPRPAGPRRNPPAPVVIWNLIRRCNLTGRHCYSISADKDFAGDADTTNLDMGTQDQTEVVNTLGDAQRVELGAVEIADTAAARAEVMMVLIEISIEAHAALAGSERGEQPEISEQP